MMNLKDIRELLKAVTNTDVTEFEFEDGDQKVRISRGATAEPAPPAAAPAITIVESKTAAPAEPAPAPAAAPAVSAPNGTNGAAMPTAAEAPPPDDSSVMVQSPIVGTFYESPSPESPAFVQIGDSVKKGQVLCIIEAMKLMNEIEAEESGVVTKRFVADAEPVEYGQSLFAIRPS